MDHPDIPLISINRIAARVISKGVHFVPKMKASDTKTVEVPPEIWEGSHGNKFTLKGVRFGHFIVIGLSTQYAKRWVVKCYCGNYEFRKSKSIRNSNNTKDKCAVCRKIEYISYGKGVILKITEKEK